MIPPTTMQALNAQPIVFAIPNENGSVTANIKFYAAINANAQNTVNAARFLQLLISDEGQQNQYCAYPSGFPVKKTSFENAFEYELNFENRNRYIITKTFTDVDAIMLNETAMQSIEKVLNNIGAANYDCDITQMILAVNCDKEWQSYKQGTIQYNQFRNEISSKIEIYVNE